MTGVEGGSLVFPYWTLAAMNLAFWLNGRHSFFCTVVVLQELACLLRLFLRHE